VNKKLRAGIYDRSGGYCERCGVGITVDNFAAHHRQLRSQGGKDSYANLVAICHRCHNFGNNSIHLNPKEAVATGWIVPGWADPAEVPICPYDGVSLRLLENGTKLTTGE